MLRPPPGISSQTQPNGRSVYPVFPSRLGRRGIALLGARPLFEPRHQVEVAERHVLHAVGVQQRLCIPSEHRPEGARASRSRVRHGARRGAQSRGILKKRLKCYAHSKLLIVDELGYLDIDEGGADLLFQLVSTLYEQRSTVITTNVGIAGWTKVLGGEVTASAIADRVCHHCHLIKITGRSYKLKDLPAEKRREG